MTTTNGQEAPPSLSALVNDAGDSPDVPMAETVVEPEAEVTQETQDAPSSTSGSSGSSPDPAFSLASELQKYGLDIADDQAGFNHLLTTIEALADQVEDEGYKQYSEKREQFQQWLASQSDKSEESVTRVTPKPEAEPKQETGGIPAGIPEVVLNAEKSGFIRRNEQGHYEATYPAAQAMADEANQAVMKHQAWARQFMMNPAEALQPILKQFAPKQEDVGQVTELRDQLKAMQDKLDAFEKKEQEQQRQQSVASVQQWVESNKDKLFTEGQLTSFGKRYQEIESQIMSISPDLSPEKLHDNVVKLLGSYQAPQSTQETLQPAAEPVAGRRKRQPATTKRNGSPLQDLTGTAQAKPPLIPTRRGAPDLHSLIAQAESPANG